VNSSKKQGFLENVPCFLDVIYSLLYLSMLLRIKPVIYEAYDLFMMST